MVFGRFEKDREALKYRCPALEYGLECKGAAQWPIRKGVRIKLSEDFLSFFNIWSRRLAMRFSRSMILLIIAITILCGALSPNYLSETKVLNFHTP